MMRKLILSVTLMWPFGAMAEGPAVAVDIAPLHSLVGMVMKDVGTPSLIVPQNASPHAHSLRPSEARALKQADLVVWIGPELTPWLEKPVTTLAQDAVILNLMDDPATQTLPFREGAAFESHEDHDHDHGHGHSEEEAHDPHVWLDPQNAARWLPRIAQLLSDIDPENKDTYAKNAQEAVASVEALDQELRERLEDLKARPFVVFHDAYHYFEARYGVEAVGAIAASDAQAPGPRRLREISDTIAATGAKCAFSEPGQSQDWITAVAPDIKVAELDPTGVRVDQTDQLYLEMMRGLEVSFRACLAE